MKTLARRIREGNPRALARAATGIENREPEALEALRDLAPFGGHARVVGIDNNIIAVRLAQSYIKRKHLASLITVELADGVRYPLADFDVIFIAINVWPIDTVLSHIANNMKPTARILVKGSHDDLVAVLEKEEFRDAFVIAATLKHPTSESFLLKKK